MLNTKGAFTQAKLPATATAAVLSLAPVSSDVALLQETSCSLSTEQSTAAATAPGLYI